MYWTEKAVDDFLHDVASIYSEPLPAHPVDSLAGPIPDLAKRYYHEPKSKVPFHRVQRLPCVLKCPQCETKIASSWLSLREMKRAQSSLPFKVQFCNCRGHVIGERQQAVEGKWRGFLEKTNASLRSYQPPPLKFLEHVKLAANLFDGKRNFLKARWSIKLSTSLDSLRRDFKPILTKNLAYIDLGNTTLDLEFLPQIQVESCISLEDHHSLILDEVITYIQESGQSVCRMPFEMSSKYLDDIYPLLLSCSYHEISYSIYRAKNKAIALAELDGRRRDVTFKNTFKTTLEKLQAKEWQVSEAASTCAEKEVPDNLWIVLKKLKAHTLTNHQLLSYPIGMLAGAIHKVYCHAEVGS